MFHPPSRRSGCSRRATRDRPRLKTESVPAFTRGDRVARRCQDAFVRRPAHFFGGQLTSSVPLIVNVGPLGLSIFAPFFAGVLPASGSASTSVSVVSKVTWMWPASVAAHVETQRGLEWTWKVLRARVEPRHTELRRRNIDRHLDEVPRSVTQIDAKTADLLLRTPCATDRPPLVLLDPLELARHRTAHVQHTFGGPSGAHHGGRFARYSSARIRTQPSPAEPLEPAGAAEPAF